MNDFTSLRQKKNNGDLSRLISVNFIGKIDNKGRITIPSDIRRSFGIVGAANFSVFQCSNGVEAAVVFKKSKKLGGKYD